MAAKEQKKWDVFYDEDDFASYEKLLLIELTDDDQSNTSFLADMYNEEKLANTPVQKLVVSLTGSQNTAFKKKVEFQ